MFAISPQKLGMPHKKNSLFTMLLSANNWIKLISVLLFCSLLVSAGRVSAQTSDEDLWSTPVNLSYSGGTTNPVVVADTSGAVHVVWQDRFTEGDQTTSARSGYAHYDGEDWEAPVMVAFPFSPQAPLLVAGDNDWVHAFWIDEEGTLWGSRVLASDFGDTASWRTPVSLALSALDVDAVVDEDGTVHVVYLRPLEKEDFPAGIYYLRAGSEGQIWEFPVALYNSTYFRSLGTGNSNLDIAYTGSGDESMLYVAWDNRPRKQVFLKRSNDHGDNWTQTQEIAGPEPNVGDYLPYGLQVSAQGSEALLIWQVDESGNNCTKYYQSSIDRGETWSEPLHMLEDFTACLHDSQLFTLGSGQTALITSIIDRPFLVIWDGELWSEPQPQDALAEFEDPEIYSRVILGCRQVELVGENRLFVVGCDLGGGGETWALVGFLEDSNGWFTSPQIWSRPTEISSGNQFINTPSLLADSEGRLHAFWTQVNDTDSSSENQGIFYTRLEEDQWSQPVAVPQTQSGDVRWISAAIDRKGRVILVWSDRKSGELKFSWAEAGLARYQTEWAPAVILPDASMGAAGHDIIEAQDGNLILAYSLPLNEARGVYLIRSVDSGESWSSLERAFDGVQNDWEMVGPPQLTQTADGTLHLMWSHLSLPGSSNQTSLHYTRSVDGGQSWSQDTQITESSAISSWLVATGERTVHLLWWEMRYGTPVLNHRLSFDSGLTWQLDSLSVYGDLQGIPGITSDPAGQLHLLHVVKDISGKLELRHSQWDGERWLAIENLNLPGYRDTEFNQVAAAVSPTGQLGVIFSGVLPNVPEGESANFLAYTDRLIVLPEDIILPLPLPTATFTQTPTPALRVTPTPSLTPQLTLDREQFVPGGPIPTTNKWAGVALGAGLGLVLVVIGITVRSWLLKGR